MFQIREIEMVHWDFWRAIRVPLDAQIVTIVGPNGSGKTTMLDALRTLLALRCSGRRDYKRYVRNNKENFAWLRGVVSNPRRGEGGLFPYLFFPITSPEVTLFCRVKKQGGDWVRHYAIAEGVVELTPETESGLQWLGVNEYKRRLESAGLTAAIAEVLALEQGDTDKLCEYSPKALLDLVFQVFGDKQVLDNYQEAKLRLKETEGELGKVEQQMAQLGLDVERMKLRSNSFLEWQALQRDVLRLESDVVPGLKYLEQWDGLLAGLTQFRLAKTNLRAKKQELDLLNQSYSEFDQHREAALVFEREAKQAYDSHFALFQQVRDAARDTEKLLKEEIRLRELAESEHGRDAVSINDRLLALKEQLASLRQWLRTAKEERQQLLDMQNALQAGRAPAPDFTRNMRGALDEAAIPHQVLTEIVEVTDATWQQAVEALLAPYRHIVLLKRASDRNRAWEIAQRLRYRHFIVPDSEPVPRANKGSVLEVVDFNGDAPSWVVQLLNRTQRVVTVEAGGKVDGDWITKEGYHKERRGGRDISVRPNDFAFGEAARQSRLGDALSRIKELNHQILDAEARDVDLSRDISAHTEQLMGMQAVVQLAARQEEFAAAAVRFPGEQDSVQNLGAELAAAQAAWEASRDAREELRVGYERSKDQRERLAGQVNYQQDLLQRQQLEIQKQLRQLRELKTNMQAHLADVAALSAVRDQFGSVREVQHLLERQRQQLANGSWETDETILARRDKLQNDYDAVQRDADVHYKEVQRTGELTHEARAAYINKLRATVRAYCRNIARLGQLAGIDVEAEMPHLDNDDAVLAQAGLAARFNFDQKGMMGMNDGEASGGQQVMKSLILLIGLMMDDANPSGFVFIDEPFAHLDIFNIDRVGAFLKATQAQYLITTPLTHNTNVYAPSDLTLTTRKKRPGDTWAPLILQTRRRVETAQQELIV
ncbi:MAG: hypothetical protein RL571_2807 [Pseudomonadota bacterium]|jgi:chromosome segregation ATPase